MTWSPCRHSLNLKGPLKTDGAVFSGALSIASACPAAAYFPNTCAGSVNPLRLRRAAQLTEPTVTVNVLGLAGSLLPPLISVAVPATNSFQPTMSLKLLLRTLTLLIAMSFLAPYQSSATTGLPSLQFALALISKV